MSTNNQSQNKDHSFYDVLKDDFRRGDFKHSVKKDYRELKDYMFDDERQKRLNEMKPLKRTLFVSWWLLKGLFFKLTPARRLLLLLAIILIYTSNNIEYADTYVSIVIEPGMIGCLILLFIIMLELKDKLIAHEELEEGHSVQKALMPEQSPRVDGWSLWLYTRSANEVGGDLVDYMKIRENLYSVTLADVAGKGLSAALLTAKLQATVRALAPDVNSLTELAEKLNKIFVRDSLPNIFASMVHAEFSSDSGKVRLINAGHLPPLISKNKKITQLEKGGAALGIMAEAKFLEQEIELQKGELMFIYSDGLSEARNMNGEFWGDERLTAILQMLSMFPVNEIGDRMLAEVDRFIGEAKPHDDISIAVLRRE